MTNILVSSTKFICSKNTPGLGKNLRYLLFCVEYQDHEKSTFIVSHVLSANGMSVLQKIKQYDEVSENL